MPIYRRGKTYWIDISAPDGSRVRQSAKTQEKNKAQQLHDKLKHELWQVSHLEKRPERYFDELMVLALRDADGQSGYENKQIYARYFIDYFSGKELSKISGERITDAIPTHCHRTRKPLSNATKNRYRSFVMRAFSLAYKNGWIDKVPYVPLLREPKVRVRWIEKHQARVLIDNLSHDWMKAVCSFALMTGARMSEILTMKWESINLVGRVAVVTADNAKSGRARALPLNDETIALLNKLPRVGDFPFTANGDFTPTINRNDFANALRKSGIEDFRFHDLRHTWASWHVQNGTPLMALKEMGGWEKLEMVNKYAHLSGEHLSKFSGIVTFLAQSENDKLSQPKISLVS